MCQYRYVYYSHCQHPELTRTSYCFQAYSLSLPRRQDTYRGVHSQRPHTGRDSISGRSTYTWQHSSSSDRNFEDRSSNYNQQVMPMIATSDAAIALGSKTQRPASDNEELPHTSMIPRSVALAPNEHGKYHEYHPDTFQTTLSLGNTAVNKLNIDFPLDSHTGFSMQLTHQNGKVKEIITRFESLRSCDAYTEPFSDDPGVHVGDRRPHTFSSTHMSEHSGNSVSQTPIEESGDELGDKVAFRQSEGVVPTGSRPQKSLNSRGRPRPSKHEKKKKKKKAGENAVDDCKDDDSRSPRKPIPPQWTSGHAPMLATAQRAMRRETRKKAAEESSPISPTEAIRTTVRSTRSSVDLSRPHALEGLTFLTKDAGAAVDSDITSQPLTRSSNKLHHAASRAPLRTPTTSPLRNSPGRNSTLKITVSPPKGSIPNFDGAGSSMSTMPGVHARSESTQSSIGGDSEYLPAYSDIYDTANEFSVSQSSSSSECSLVAFPFGCHEGDAPALELTDVGKDVRKMNEDGMTSRLPLKHSRGRSESHLRVPTSIKPTLNRPAMPKLALKIPHSVPATTDRKSPLVSSASSTGSGMSMGSSPTSRIPISAVGKHDNTVIPSKSASIRKRPKSKVGASFPIESPSPPLRTTDSHSDIKKDGNTLEALGMVSGLDAVPPPQTPGTASMRHVRTVNSSGTTPIISSSSSRIREPHSLASSRDQLRKHQITPSILGLAGNPSNKISISEMENTFSSGGLDAEHVRKEETRKVSGTSATSNLTVKAPLPNQDPIMRDSAIIYSRRRSDASAISGTSGSNPLTQDGTSTSFTTTSVASVTDHLKHLLQGQGRSRRLQAQSESAVSEATSSLRATAPEFIPLQQAQPAAPFNSFQPDQTYGFPMYHYWYPVQYCPDQKLYVDNYKPKWNPIKRGRNRSNKRSGRKQNSEISVAAPDECSSPAKVASQADPKESTQAPEISTHPFASQMQFLGNEPRVQDERQAGTGIRRIDWASIRNVPSQINRASRNIQLGHNTLPIQGRFAHYVQHPNLPLQNGMYDHYAGPYRSRKWGPIAGVPLTETAPFPNPAPPPAPKSKGYVGYAIEQDCGTIDVVSAGEMIGGACNNCEPDH